MADLGFLIVGAGYSVLVPYLIEGNSQIHRVTWSSVTFWNLLAM